MHGRTISTSLTSLVAQTVKNLPAMKKAWVQSLGWEDPLEKEMATHSSIFAWRIPWTEEPGCSPWCREESDMSELLILLASTHYIPQAVTTKNVSRQ